jgi:hypothetical protein
MKNLLFLFSILYLTSCSTPGRVCGGGRKRCVQFENISADKKLEKILIVRNVFL